MSANRELWEKGDFTRIAATMRASGEALVDGLGIAPGMAVLDLGCGDGTTALPAAERGAEVLGVDLTAKLLAAGEARAAAAGLDNVSFQEGDASQLVDLDDERFDLTLSVFGAMFAPRPYDVAKEMVRVTRPGGRIVMGNWIPGDPYGPTMNAFAAAAADGREGLLQAELDALFADQNRSLDGGTEIAATFLLVNVTRSYP